MPLTHRPASGSRDKPLPTGSRPSSQRETISIYALQTARLAVVAREGYSGPQVISFHCPNCPTPEDSRLVEFELEVVDPVDQALDDVAFVRRNPTRVRLFVRVTRDQTEQILASFGRRDNADMLMDICRAPEDAVPRLVEPAQSGGPGPER